MEVEVYVRSTEKADRFPNRCRYQRMIAIRGEIRPSIPYVVIVEAVTIGWKPS